MFVFCQPAWSVAICHSPFMRLCYGVCATSLFHYFIASPWMPLPSILYINKNETYIIYSFIYYNLGNGSLLALCLGQCASV